MRINTKKNRWNNWNKAKWQRLGFLGMLLSILGASLLGNALTGREVIRAGERTIRAGTNF